MSLCAFFRPHSLCCAPTSCRQAFTWNGTLCTPHSVLHIVYSTRSTCTSVPPHFNDPKPEITISREITISTPFQRPQAHPARRDPRRHNEQKLTVPDQQAAGMRHRPNFGKRKQLMASKPCIHVAIVTCASHHMRFTHITCPSSICADA